MDQTSGKGLVCWAKRLQQGDKAPDLSMTVWDADALGIEVPAVHISRREVIREELILIGRRGCVGPAAAGAPPECFLQAIHLSDALHLCQPGPGVLGPP